MGMSDMIWRLFCKFSGIVVVKSVEIVCLLVLFLCLFIGVVNGLGLCFRKCGYGEVRLCGEGVVVFCWVGV